MTKHTKLMTFITRMHNSGIVVMVMYTLPHKVDRWPLSCCLPTKLVAKVIM